MNLVNVFNKARRAPLRAVLSTFFALSLLGGCACAAPPPQGRIVPAGEYSHLVVDATVCVDLGTKSSARSRYAVLAVGVALRPEDVGSREEVQRIRFSAPGGWSAVYDEVAPTVTTVLRMSRCEGAQGAISIPPRRR